MIRAFATVLVLLLSSVAGFASLSGSAAEIPDPGDSATTPVAKGEASADPAHGQVDEIIVVCKTHFDLGYTHRVKDLLHYYRTTMIDRALGIMEASADLPPAQQFVWTSPGWVMERVLDDWPGQTPERRRRIETAFQSGKFVTHALPFSIGAELLEPEQFARGYVFADTISRRYGLPLARGAKTTDVPSQSRALATGLAHGGVKFMHIGCNWPSGYVHDLPPIFWWQGPDGSRVLTMYSSIYGTCTAFWAWGGKTDRNIGQNLLPPADWPYKTWVAIIVTGDNSGPPRADGVQAIFAEAARKLPGARVRMGTMEEFAVALLAENPDLPVVKGEMPDTWIHGCMSDPGGMRTARNVAPRMSAAETLNTHLRSWGVAVADPVSELARAHEQALLYNEHTWGGAAGVRVYGDEFQKLPPQQHANLEGSWEDKTDYIRTADRITAAVLERDLASLAQAVKCAGPRAVVFNPLPWPRSGLVQLADRSFLADDVPGCGYKTFPIPAASAPAALTGELLDGDTLENEFLQVKLDAVRGGIVSLVDQRTGRQWADANAAHSLGQYLNERFDKLRTDGYCRDYQQGRWGDTLHSGMHKPGLPADVPYRAACSNGGALTITRDAVGQSAVLTFPARPGDQLPASALRVTLYRGQPYLDIELSIRDKARDNWPEADWLCLPFKIDEPQFRVARSLGVMDPAQDILRRSRRHADRFHGCGDRRLSARSSADQSRHARLLEVLARFRAAAARGLSQPVQQPMEHQLPLLVSRHVEFPCSCVDVRGGYSVGRRADQPGARSPLSVAGGQRGRGGRKLAPGTGRLDRLPPRRRGQRVWRRSRRQRADLVACLGTGGQCGRGDRPLAVRRQVLQSLARQSARRTGRRAAGTCSRPVRLSFERVRARQFPVRVAGASGPPLNARSFILTLPRTPSQTPGR